METHKSNKTAISIIIPIGNAKLDLNRCLDSILSQTLNKIEIIIIHMGQEGNLSSLCSAYADKDTRIKLLHQDTECLGAAFNAGISTAAGEYIAFVDSCDWLEPEMYDVMYEIASDQKVDVVHCLKYSNKEGGRPKISNPYTNAFVDTTKRDRCVNEKSDYKFYVPMLLFYSEDLYSTIYRKEFLTESQIKFSEIPGSNAQNLGFTFLVFCYLGSFYIHEAALYHLNQKRDYFTNTSFNVAIDSIGEYYHIKNHIKQRGLEERFISKRYLHIAMAKIFRHIKHRYLVHCKTISQKREFLRSVEPILKDYYPLKNDNMFLNGKEKRLYKRLLRHPLKTSVRYSLNLSAKRLCKRMLTDVSFHSKHKQIRIFGFRFFFYKNTSDYFTFNLLYLPVIRCRRYKNIEKNSVITKRYFLGTLYLTTIEEIDFRKSTWFSNRRIYNPIYYYFANDLQWGLNKRVSDHHVKIFPAFKDTNLGGTVKIYGNGLILSDAINVAEGKVIACNKNLNIFDKSPDYIFASEHISSNAYYENLITKKTADVFFDCANINSLILAKRSKQANQIDNINFYYGDWRFYDDIRDDIAVAPLAFFGDTVHSAIHFALYTNPSVIYLIGCDVYDEGIRKNNRQFSPTGYELLIGYKKLKLFKDKYYPNTKIICVNPQGITDIFENQCTKEYINNQQNQKLSE